MLLTELKIPLGVNQVTTWLEKKLSKLGYELRFTYRNSPTKQYIHVISGTESLTIRVIDPSLPQGEHEALDYDYTVLCGITNAIRKQMKLRPDKESTSEDKEDALNFIKTHLK